MTGKIGVFYFVDGVVYAHAFDPQGLPIGEDGIIQSPISHTDLFDELRTYPKLVKAYPYVFKKGVWVYRNYFLRGRVVYDANAKAFSIWSSEYLLSHPAIVSKVMAAFRLDPNRVAFEELPTYEMYDRQFEKDYR